MNQLWGWTTFFTFADMARGADVVGDPDEGRFLDDALVELGQRRVAGLGIEGGARIGDELVELLVAEVAPVVRDRREGLVSR